MVVQVEKELDDISDVYVPMPSRHYVFIGYVSMVLLVLMLLPLFLSKMLHWREAIIQGNNYPGECGVTVTVRHCAFHEDVQEAHQNLWSRLCRG